MVYAAMLRLSECKELAHFAEREQLRTKFCAKLRFLSDICKYSSSEPRSFNHQPYPLMQ